MPDKVVVVTVGGQKARPLPVQPVTMEDVLRELEDVKSRLRTVENKQAQTKEADPRG